MCNTCVHLHNHTDSSLNDALPSATELARAARRTGMPAVALTDHGRMSGLVELVEACRGKYEDFAPIKPILGVEFYVVNDRHKKEQEMRESGKKAKPKSWHITMLATNLQGYQNLLQLNHIGNLDGYYYEPRIDREVIEKYSEGIICLSGCIGSEVNQAILRDDIEGARETLGWYKDVFGDRYYGEVQYHGIDIQKKAMPILKKLCYEMEIPLVASNDIHYLEPEDWALHDKFIGLREESGVSGKSTAYATRQFYMKSAEEMSNLFLKLDPSAVPRTLEIAERVEDFFQLNPKHLLPQVAIDADNEEFKSFKSKNYPTHGDNGSYLAYQAAKGLREKGLVSNKQYTSRLKSEIDTVINMGVEDYFLIQMELTEFMRSHNIRYGIRGSGVGSVLNYATNISTVDPLTYNLMFERFLNPGRGTKYVINFKERSSKDYSEANGMIPQDAAKARLKVFAEEAFANDPEMAKRRALIEKEIWVLASQYLATYLVDLIDEGFRAEQNESNLWIAHLSGIAPPPTGEMIVRAYAELPDIDTDVDDRYRHTIIEWLIERFGADHVVMIGTFGRYGLKSVIQKILKNSEKFIEDYGANVIEKVNEISKMIQNRPTTHEGEWDEIEETAKVFPVFRKHVSRYATEFSDAVKLVGKKSFIGVHAAGVLVSSEPLSKHCPISVTKEGVVCAYDMDTVGKVGLIKFDILGLSMLQKIDRAVESITQRTGKVIDPQLISTNPTDDKVFNTYRLGNTYTLWQVGSNGMKKTLNEVQVNNINDLIAVISLFRPGPLEYIPLYAERKRNPESVEYPNDIVKKYMGETYNIPVYQEQVMYVCLTLAGFNFDEVDVMRKAISKKDPEKLKKSLDLFAKKCKERGIDASVYQAIIETWRNFGGYAFNKAHATGYADLSYQTGWLYTYYPTEWLAACIQADGIKKDSKSYDDSKKLDAYRKECHMRGVDVIDPDVQISNSEVTINESGQIVLPLFLIPSVGKSSEKICLSAPYNSAKDLFIRGDVNRAVMVSLYQFGALRSLSDNEDFLNADDLTDAITSWSKEKQANKKAEKASYVVTSPFANDGRKTTATTPIKTMRRPSLFDD